MPNFHHELFGAVALDFDGTIADTDSAHLDARLQAYEELAVELEQPKLEAVSSDIHAEAHRHGPDSLSINSWVLAQIGLSRAPAKAIVKRKTSIFHAKAEAGLDSMPGAINFINAAQELWGENIFIVTTAYRDAEVIPFLARHSLQRVIRDRQIIAREDVQTLKPSPEAYTLLLKRLELEATPERLLVVEDTPNGVEAARGAGAMVAGLVKPDDPEDLLKQINFRRADEFVASFEELSAMVNP